MAYNRIGADKYGEFVNGEQRTPDRIAGKNLFYRDLRREDDPEYREKRRKDRSVRKVRMDVHRSGANGNRNEPPRKASA